MRGDKLPPVEGADHDVGRSAGRVGGRRRGRRPVEGEVARCRRRERLLGPLRSAGASAAWSGALAAPRRQIGLHPSRPARPRRRSSALAASPAGHEARASETARRKERSGPAGASGLRQRERPVGAASGSGTAPSTRPTTRVRAWRERCARYVVDDLGEEGGAVPETRGETVLTARERSVRIVPRARAGRPSASANQRPVSSTMIRRSALVRRA